MDNNAREDLEAQRALLLDQRHALRQKATDNPEQEDALSLEYAQMTQKARRMTDLLGDAMTV